MNLKFRRVGRPKKAKYFGSVVLIIVMTGLMIFGLLMVQTWRVELVEGATYNQMLESKGDMFQEVVDENEALREKLEFSSKVVTSDTTKELVRFYIRKYFPKTEWARAEAVSKCESGLNPQSINDKNKNGSVDRGAWQINSVHAKRFQTMYAINWEVGAHDLDLSTKYAKFLFDHSGFSPWVCSRIIKV